MEIWVLITVVIVAFYKLYQLIEERNDKLQATYTKLLESHNEAMEILSVSTIAGPILSTMLIDTDTKEALEKARTEKINAMFAVLPTINDSKPKLSHEESEEIQKHMDEVIDNLSIFSRNARERYIKLAWDIYFDAKSYKK